MKHIFHIVKTINECYDKLRMVLPCIDCKYVKENNDLPCSACDFNPSKPYTTTDYNNNIGYQSDYSASEIDKIKYAITRKANLHVSTQVLTDTINHIATYHQIADNQEIPLQVVINFLLVRFIINFLLVRFINNNNPKPIVIE